MYPQELASNYVYGREYRIAGNFWRELFSKFCTLSENLFPKNFCDSVGNERL